MSTVIELHCPRVEFWIVPDRGIGEWVTVSRYAGRLHVRGTYGDCSVEAEKLARIAYEAMEDAFKKVSLGRERSLVVRIKS